MKKIDLNSDLGESFGPWKMGHDEDLLTIVTSANIACGFHAGDPLHMRQTVQTCKINQVGIGAHPGFADLNGFGRYEISGIPANHLKASIIYQIGALRAIAAAEGETVRHVKMHGALANMASRDQELADTIMSAVCELDSSLTVITIASTCLERAAKNAGVKFAAEIFADRAYNSDATLVSRSEADALILDPAICADNMLRTVETGFIFSRDGAKLEVNADTICVHGDTQEAVRIATAVRNRLDQAGIEVVKFD